jgi:hypothetical protein
MPDRDTTLHLDMLRDFRRGQIKLWVAAGRGYASRSELERAVASGELAAEPGPNGSRLLKIADLERLYGRPRGDIYGMHWGDPEYVEPLAFIKRRYLLPLLKQEHVVLEIGPGGGRWTQYLRGARRLYVVDYYQEMLDELRRSFDAPNIVPVRNNGDDFPGVPDAEVDLVFSFDAFVHFELPLVESYLRNMWRIMKPGARGFIHYSDKTKIMAAINEAFAANDPATMRELVRNCGYTTVLEDTTTMWHSAIIVFARPEQS